MVSHIRENQNTRETEFKEALARKWHKQQSHKIYIYMIVLSGLQYLCAVVGGPFLGKRGAPVVKSVEPPSWLWPAGL